MSVSGARRKKCTFQRLTFYLVRASKWWKATIRCILVIILSVIFISSFKYTPHLNDKTALENISKPNPPQLILLCSDFICDPSEIWKKLFMIEENREIIIACATKHCFSEVRNISRIGKTTLLRISIRQLASGTPLWSFVANQNILKLRSGPYFPILVHEVSLMLLLWHKGGHFVDIRGSWTSFVYHQSEDRERDWIGHGGMLQSCHFSPQSGMMGMLMNIMKENLDRGDFLEWNIDKILCEREEIVEELFFWPKWFHCFLLSKESSTYSLLKGENYGVLSYEHRVRAMRNANAGDEVQALAGLQFLPFIDAFVDRDTWSIVKHGGLDVNGVPILQNREEFRYEKKFKTFLNAWYGSKDNVWPPPPHIDPFLFSLFVGGDFKENFISEESRIFLQKYGPIGARDASTLRFFQAAGIQSYFSGCATLLLRSFSSESEKRTEVLIVDAYPEHVDLIVPEFVKNSSVSIIQNIRRRQRSLMDRYRVAQSLLKRYSRAKLVITSRIHCALPCVALGTPVIFISAKKLPGGGSNRVTGLTELFHTAVVDNTKLAYSGLLEFNWHQPPQNPHPEKFHRYRAQMWYEVRKHTRLHDFAITLGTVPYKNLARRKTREDKFFQISNSISFSIRHRRSLESIFYSHPHASVTLLSNHIDEDDVEIFQEMDYDVKVLKYSLDEYLNYLSSCHYEMFAQKVKLFKSSSQYSNLNEEKEYLLLKMVILFLHGGTIVSDEMVLLRDVSELNNVVYFKDQNENDYQDTFLKFNKQNNFIGEYILYSLTVIPDWGLRASAFSKLAFYSTQKALYSCNRSERAKESCQGPMKSYDLNELSNEAFYHFEGEKSRDSCFWRSAKEFPQKENAIIRNAFGVVFKTTEMYSRRTIPGTICQKIFNARCIFCSQVV